VGLPGVPVPPVVLVRLGFFFFDKVKVGGWL